MSRNTLVEVQNKMESLKRKRAAALEEIETKCKAAQNDLITATEEMEEATSRTDVDAYEKAAERKRKAQIACDMYTARADQIKNTEMISGMESDEIINSLVKYERQLAAGLANDAKDAIEKLLETVGAYFAEVERCQSVYKEWTRTVHAIDNIAYWPEDYRGSGLAHQLQQSLRMLLGAIEGNKSQQTHLRACEKLAK